MRPRRDQFAPSTTNETPAQLVGLLPRLRCAELSPHRRNRPSLWLHKHRQKSLLTSRKSGAMTCDGKSRDSWVTYCPVTLSGLSGLYLSQTVLIGPCWKVRPLSSGIEGPTRSSPTPPLPGDEIERSTPSRYPVAGPPPRHQGPDLSGVWRGRVGALARSALRGRLTPPYVPWLFLT